MYNKYLVYCSHFSFSANALLLAICYDYFEESIVGKPEDIMKKMKECYEKVSPEAIEVLDKYFNTNKLGENLIILED